ncbi:MAG TPA: hypothetical protein VGQ51_18280 [Puia sp.]|jgi:hypothetical protein|nr:hypothetical protein [Puia sp.]
MKTLNSLTRSINAVRQILPIILLASALTAAAQDGHMQYYRPNDKTGLNVFETTKNDTTSFRKLHVKVGGNFEETFQNLNNKNTASSMTMNGYSGNVNSLEDLTPGFDLAMANLNLDVQLADGIRVNLTSYLASRHHEDAWVKGGYIQFDKLLFLHSSLIDNIMKSVTIKIGQFDVNYGDQVFRRTDGGNSIYNPFIENYIMDEFATEIGGEVIYHCKSGLFALGGITNGELNPTILAATKVDSATGQLNKYDPAWHGKLGYDKQLTKDFRLRLSQSFYIDKSANSNTLFGGDRTGSHYYGVMSNAAIAKGTTLNNANDYNPFSGRLNPGFSEEVNAYMSNAFLKFKGLELFGTYENAKGRTSTEKTQRQATQWAFDAIYRFTRNENFWVGFRYNTVNAALPGSTSNVTIEREAGSVGWFLNHNVMLKLEYVNQVYMGYPSTNILNGGKFYGWCAEASIAF